MCAIMRRLAILLLLLNVGCGTGNTSNGDTNSPVVDLALTSATIPSPALLNSTISLHGANFDKGTLALTLQGSFTPKDGSPATAQLILDVTVASPSRASATISAAVISALGAEEGTFSGKVTLTLTSSSISAASQPLDFALVKELKPSITTISSTLLHFGDEITVTGENFLVGNEGTSVFNVYGTFVDEDGKSTKIGGQIGLIAESRHKGTFTFLPGLVGVRAGAMDASAWVLNLYPGNVEASKGASTPYDFVVARPVFTSISTFEVSRGKSITFEGLGLLPILTNTGTTQSTFLRMEGELLLDSGATQSLQGGQALMLSFEPDALSYQKGVFVLRAEDLGNANISGTFQGTISPVLFYEGTEQPGEPFHCNLQGEDATLCKVTILPQVQIVFVKFLDDFPLALDRYGLRAVDSLVRERILAVLRRDYDGISIEFRDQRPTDYAEYSVIEVGGVDPNHQDLFGLDNTCGGENGSCKDVGNKRFNDIIGGTNAISSEKGYPSYGGVFVDSFFQFSKKKGSSLLGTEQFDTVFAFCAPELGGNAVNDGEYPGSARDTAIAKAILVLGNLIGNTMTHEIGHSLGMTAQGGADTFHNLVDKPLALMDKGGDRPFSERAELNGEIPLFRCHNRDYLESVLPKLNSPKGPCID